METLLGVVLGYVLRGTTGSEGFRELVESARSVTATDQFQSFVLAARSHAAHVIKDLSDSLSQTADQVAGALGGEAAGAAAGAEPAEWEVWPPADRRHGRPFPDDVTWPDR